MKGRPRLRVPLAQSLVRLLWWADIKDAYIDALVRSRQGLPPLVWTYGDEVLEGLPDEPDSVAHAWRYIRRIARWKLGRKHWPRDW